MMYFVWKDLSVGIIAVPMNSVEKPYDELITYMNKVSPFIKGMEAIRDGTDIVVDVAPIHVQDFDYDFYPLETPRATPVVTDEKDLIFAIFHHLYCGRYHLAFHVDSSPDWWTVSRSSFIRDNEDFFVRRLNHVLDRYREQVTNKEVIIRDHNYTMEIATVLDLDKETSDEKILNARNLILAHKYDPPSDFERYYHSLISYRESIFRPKYKKTHRGRLINTGRYEYQGEKETFLSPMMDGFFKKEQFV